MPRTQSPTTVDDWTPPFATHSAPNLTCPECGEHDVQVHDKGRYDDGATVDAYCDTCHAVFEVGCSVDIEFWDLP